MTRRVVITGVGVVSPIGIGRDAFWAGLASGRSGVRAIEGFDASPFPSRIAAEIAGFEPSDFIPRRRTKHMDRTAVLGVCAARMALADAALALEGAPSDRIGVVMGTSRGHYDVDYVRDRRAAGGGRWRGITPEASLLGFPEACASQISMELSVHGPSLTVASGGASGLDAIGQAWRAVRWGELDVVFAGGSQAPLAPALFSAYCMLGRLSGRNDDPAGAARPFDGGRDGMVLGEGAGVLVVEDLAHARARGARIYAEILGHASTARRNGGAPPARAAGRAVSLALSAAGVEPAAIDYVCATGLSLPEEDIEEARALEDALGDRARRVPVSAPSSMVGHSIGAAGSVELIAALLALERQTLPPTINYATPDPACALDCVPNVARPSRIRTVLKTSFGFGGQNAALVARRPEPAAGND